MPEIWGIRLIGELPDWVSAKDVLLEMLRRHGVEGGLKRVIEYYGPGVETLSAMDRHVIANMGAELGATTTVFPSDKETKRFLESEGRGEDWQQLSSDEDAGYDVEDEIDLSSLVPLIAEPSSPGNVVPVEEAQGKPITQSYIGSSANPGWRDFAISAAMLREKTISPGITFEINPTSRQLLYMLTKGGQLAELIAGGGRLHQTGCNGCIGMGQAPASGGRSLRTVPRNFPGRSGTVDDRVYLCSPETATASAITGKITDPRQLDMDCPGLHSPERTDVYTRLLEAPLEPEEAKKVELVKGPNIESLPELDRLPDRMELEIVLKVGDDLSTDEILPAGSDILPLRSNIPRISEFSFSAFCDDYPSRAEQAIENGCDGHAVLGGRNYGQGSSREHAALGPRYQGLRVVLAESFARIHRQNLINYGVLPLTISEEEADTLAEGDILILENLGDSLLGGEDLLIRTKKDDKKIRIVPDFSTREIELIGCGGYINWLQEERA